MPYTADKPNPGPSVEELEARVPGWGADRDIADPSASPPGHVVDGAPVEHWSETDRQPDDPRRERSIEHGMLPPVYGTAQPLHGVSGAIRRFAYDRFGEDRVVRWLLLVVGDRVESTGAHVRSFFTKHPDNPITQTGVLAEFGHRPIASRFGRGRLDGRHTWLDPILVAGPFVVAFWLIAKAVAKVVRR